MNDILVLGDFYCDLIFTGLPEPPRVGTEFFGTGFDMVPGAVYRTVLALQRLGLRVGWPCDFGNDFFSQFVWESARRDGIDTSLFRQQPFPLRRISVAFSFAHDRGFISYADQHDQSMPLDLIAQQRPRVVLLPSLRYGDAHATIVAAAHAVGALVYMDCQARAETLALPEVRAAVQRVDVFAPNADEALHLTGAVTIEQALAQLAELTPLVIVKRGAAGAIAQMGEKIASAPGIPVQVIDTTGAGDCFNAGFLYAHLQGRSLETCLRCGNICGGLSTTAHDHAVLPSAEKLETWLAHY